MVRLLSKQYYFVNQVSRLEALVKEAGHECIFIPKFHCELNPIEMVSLEYYLDCIKLKPHPSSGDGSPTDSADVQKEDVLGRKARQCWLPSTHAPLMS